MTIVHRFIVRVTIKVISFCHLQKWFIPRISWLCSTIYGLPFSIICFYIGCRDTIIFEIVITKLQFHMIKIAFEFAHNRHISRFRIRYHYKHIDLLIFWSINVFSLHKMEEDSVHNWGTRQHECKVILLSYPFVKVVLRYIWVVKCLSHFVIKA